MIIRMHTHERRTWVVCVRMCVCMFECYCFVYVCMYILCIHTCVRKRVHVRMPNTHVHMYSLCTQAYVCAYACAHVRACARVYESKSCANARAYASTYLRTCVHQLYLITAPGQCPGAVFSPEFFTYLPVSLVEN